MFLMSESRRLVKAGVREAAVRLGGADDEPDGSARYSELELRPLWRRDLGGTVEYKLHPNSGWSYFYF